MADLVETGPAREDLDFGAQLLLWSVRLWVLGVCHRKATIEIIDRAYTMVGCPDGARLLNTAMQTLTLSARRVLDVRPPCFRSISSDEQRLLDAVGCYQQADTVRPRFIISAMSHAQSTPAVLNALEGLSRSLLRGGLRLGADIASIPAATHGLSHNANPIAGNAANVVRLHG